MKSVISDMNVVYLEVKPIFHTIGFEIKKQWKKFVVFLIITIAIIVLQGFILNAVFPTQLLPTTQASFLSDGLGFLTSFIILFASCFFFSGIICSEFSDKTGYIVFPKINKYKFIVGKYLGNLFLEVCVIFSYYFLLGLFSYYFYDLFTGDLLLRYLQSFFIAIFYTIAMSSFVTFFSSFMKSVNVTIVVTILILFIGFNISQSIILLIDPNIEPLYSLSYIALLISALLLIEFPDPNYNDIEFGNFTFRTWITPTIEMGFFILFLYIVIGFLLAAILFKRRQL